MSTEEKIALIEEIMDVDEGTLAIDSVLEDIEEWDSLSKLALIAKAKQAFKLILKPEVISEFVTVGDICEYLNE